MIRLPSRRSTAGFTLLEMLVVVVMIGVLFAIASPSWLSLLNNRRANSARDQVLQAIRLSQSEARRQRQDFILSFDPDANPPELAINGINQILGEGELEPEMVGLEVVDAGGASIDVIEFSHDGTLDADEPSGNVPIVITVSAPADTGVKRCIIIQTLLGATTSVSGDDDVNDDC